MIVESAIPTFAQGLKGITGSSRLFEFSMMPTGVMMLTLWQLMVMACLGNALHGRTKAAFDLQQLARER